MDADISLLISTVLAACAIVILMSVNDKRPRKRVRKDAKPSAPGIREHLLAPGMVKRIDYGIALAAGTGMVVLVARGLASLRAYLGFVLFIAVMLCALAFGIDHGSARVAKRAGQ